MDLIHEIICVSLTIHFSSFEAIDSKFKIKCDSLLSYDDNIWTVPTKDTKGSNTWYR